VRVWLITVGEPLPTDTGNQRLLRTGLLARMLTARGHDVVWWSSNFIHMLKSFRSSGETEVLADPKQRIILLHGGGYRRNISWDRVKDHAMLAERFEARSRTELVPDIIVASLPTIELALSAVEFGKRHGVPVVVDIRDLWPDAMVDLLPKIARPLGALLTSRLRAKVRATCAGAAAITGHAESFVDWGVRHAGRLVTSSDRVFPHGYPVNEIEANERSQAIASLRERGVDLSAGRFTAVYVGTIGNQPEIDPVIDAAHRLRLDPRFQFVIAGEGSRLEHYRMAARGLSNTALPGWLNRAEIRVLLDHATAGLVPYPHRGDWLTALPNKFAEYLSASVPLLVSLTTGKMLEFAEANGCGLGYGHSGERLANRLVELAESPERLSSLRHAAKRAFETHFKADVVYGGMVDYLERLVASRATVQRRTS